MTNEELRQAITDTSRLIYEMGPFDPRQDATLAHYKHLLAEQLRRASGHAAGTSKYRPATPAQTSDECERQLAEYMRAARSMDSKEINK